MAKREQRPTSGNTTGAAATPTMAALRRLVAQKPEPTPESVLRDLEIIKHHAVERDDIATALRATELQGRAIGAFRRPDRKILREFSDTALINGIARDDAAFAALLEVYLNGGAALLPSPSSE